MIEAPPEGGVRIVLCTGDGMVEAIMTVDGQIRHEDRSNPDGHDDRPPCDWALHGQSTLAAATATVDAVLIRELSFAYVGDVPLHVRRAEVLAPAARGPPTFI